MLEALKGFDIFNTGFIIPVIIGLVILFILAKVAKKLVKLAVFLAIIGLAVLLYLQMK
jgi:hypothetical protein